MLEQGVYLPPSAFEAWFVSAAHDQAAIDAGSGGPATRRRSSSRSHRPTLGALSMVEHTVVHLLRHGEVHNPEGVLYGRLPGYRLSDRGRRHGRAHRRAPG